MLYRVRVEYIDGLNGAVLCGLVVCPDSDTFKVVAAFLDIARIHSCAVALRANGFQFEFASVKRIME